MVLNVTPAAHTPPSMSLVNLAARQRMLSQRLLLQALLAANGDRAQHQAATESLALFSSSQKQLETVQVQGPKEDVRAKAIRDIYHGANGVAGTIRDFQVAMEATLAAILARADSASERIAAVVERNDAVLAALNQATAVFDAVAASRTADVRKHLADVVSSIQRVAREARVVSFNARVMAARAGDQGREFNVVAQVLIGITQQVDELSVQAMGIVRELN